MMLASAEDSVADTMPAIVIGPNTDTSCITCKLSTLYYACTLHIHEKIFRRCAAHADACS